MAGSCPVQVLPSALGVLQVAKVLHVVMVPSGALFASALMCRDLC